MRKEEKRAAIAERVEPVPVIVDTRCGPVEYAEFGDGPAVVALHGAMGGYDHSLLLARTIGAAGFRYIAVSRPGYLGSPLGSRKSPAQQADLCAALLDALGVPSAAVMAVSGGGPCALHFAMRHRERCGGLVLASTCGQRNVTPIPFSFHLMRFLVRWPAFERSMRKKALANIGAAAARSIADPAVLAHTMEDSEAGPLFTELLMSTCDRMAERMPGTENDIAVTRTTDYPLEEVAVPALVIHGTADRLAPFSPHATALSSRIPGAELLALEGGEHVAIFTHLQEVRPRVARFLRERALSGSGAAGSAAVI
ncbi:MAG TPA: alpha/beta hydrolase [Armatimonadota bacterium]|jgi:pimeloyl-ACP methyl ester carboxylesterase